MAIGFQPSNVGLNAVLETMNGRSARTARGAQLSIRARPKAVVDSVATKYQEGHARRPSPSPLAGSSVGVLRFVAHGPRSSLLLGRHRCP
jgi:hypothetical protein